jgi:tetratricopeptide (TPR) repeat protein
MTITCAGGQWKKQPAQAIAALERAIALDPNDADGYAALAHILNFTGKPQEALRLVQKAMRLNPHYPNSSLATLGIAYTLAGRYEEAIAAFKKALTRNPDFLLVHIFLAVLYSGAGWQEQARAEAAEVLRLNPQFSLEVWRQTLPVQNQTELGRFLDLLRQAGLH